METTATSSGIKFKATLLAAFAFITAPGKYLLKVQNNVTEKNLYKDDSGERYIVGLKAIAKDKQAQVLATFEGKEEVEIEETNGLFMTASIWKNNGIQPELPMKGEEVECTVGLVPDQHGVEVLRITNIRVKAAQRASAFSLTASAVENREVEQHA